MSDEGRFQNHSGQEVTYEPRGLRSGTTSSYVIDGLERALDGVESSALGGIAIEASLVMADDWWRRSPELGCGIASLASGCRRDVLVLPVLR